MSTIEKWELSAVTIGTTEWSITTNSAGPDVETDDGFMSLFVFVPAAAVLADKFSLGVYETINGVQYEIDRKYFCGRGVDFAFPYPSLHLGIGWDMTFKKESGTDRALSCHINEAS